MKKTIRFASILIFMLHVLLGSEGVLAQEVMPTTGRWVGGVAHGSNWFFLDLDMDRAQLRRSPFAAPQPLLFMEGYPTIISEEKVVELRGDLEGNVYRGQAAEDPFVLYRVESDAPDLIAFEGNYQIEDETLYIYPLAPTSGVHADLMVRRTDGVVPLIFVAQDTFYSQRGETFVFHHDAQGTINGVTITTWDNVVQESTRVDRFTKEAVTFQNGNITLNGILLMPVNARNVPAVVLTHGSGEGLARVYQYEGTRFAQQGIAVLAYDKREGWESASLIDLADDALAGVAYLQTRPEVNTNAVGVWGVSQGGWVAQLAASRSDKVAFVSVLSPSLAPNQQNLYRRDNNFDFSGYPDNAIVARRRAYALVQEISVLARDGRLPSWLGQDTFLIDLDVESVWQQVQQPVLIEMGANDKLVPLHDSIALIRDALQVVGNQDYTVVVYEGADHGAYIGNGYQFAPRVELRFAPNYYTQSPTWISQRFGSEATPPALPIQSAPDYSATTEFGAEGIYSVLPWYGSPYTQLGLVVSFGIVFAMGIAGGFLRRNEVKYRWIAGLSGLNLVLLVGVVYFIFQVLDMPESALLSDYGVTNYLFVLAYLSVLLTLVFALRSWRTWRGTALITLGSLIGVVTLAFWWFLWYWKVL